MSSGEFPNGGAISGIQVHVWAWIVGAIFTGVAVILSLIHVKWHFEFNRSLMAKPEIRILMMVPIYAVEAFLGLILKQYTQYWDVLREMYEAVVIWSFYQFCLTYLGGAEGLHEIMVKKESLKQEALRKKDDPKFNIASLTPEEKEALHAGHHIFPFWFLQPYGLANNEFQLHTGRGILQYVPIRVICALATLVLDLFGYYNEGVWRPSAGYPWITIVVNASQIWALYNVVLFYHGLYQNIKNIRPLAKFLSIKLVVFATFWQGVIVVMAVDVHFLGATQTYTSNQVAAGIQDFMICIEMAVAAALHIWVWPPKEFANYKAPPPSLWQILNPIDLLVDMHSHLVQPVLQQVTRRKINVTEKETRINSDGNLVTYTTETKIVIETPQTSPGIEMASPKKQPSGEILLAPSAQRNA